MIRFLFGLVLAGIALALFTPFILAALGILAAIFWS